MVLQRAVPALILLASLLLAAPASRAQGNLIVVAQDGSGDVLTVHQAIQNAQPGDVLLVKPGNYVPIGPLDPGGFLDINKPLTIVGDGPGVSIGVTRIRNIGTGNELVLRNVRIAAPVVPGTFLEMLGVRNSGGAVLIEDCTLTGLTGTFESPSGFPGVDVRNCTGVTLTRCTITGGQGYTAAGFPFPSANGAGGPGVVATNSSVALHGCTVRGGHGGIDPTGTFGSKPGGVALRTQLASTVFVGGGSVTGGAGSNGGSPAQPAQAAGGHGIYQSEPGSLVRLVGVTPQGGAGGLLSDGSSGPAGTGLLVAGGASQNWPQSARHTSLDAVIREGGTGTLRIGGVPGDLAKIFLAFDLLHYQLPGPTGVFNLADPLIGPYVLGTIPASGVFEVPIVFGQGLLGPFPVLRLDVQSFSFGPDGLLLGNPTETLLVPAGT